MRRFLLVVFGGCAAASAAFALLPGQAAGYLALFEQHARVNSGVAVTVLAQPVYPVYPADPVSSWGSRPAR